MNKDMQGEISINEFIRVFLEADNILKGKLKLFEDTFFGDH